MAPFPDYLNHILIITPGFPENEEDTVCLPAVQQAVLCYKKIYPQTEITIVSLQYPFQGGYYKWHGIDVHAIGGKNRGGLYTALTIVKAFYMCVRLQKNKAIDAIICLWLRDTSLVGKMLAKLYKMPYITWMHGQDAKAGNKYFNRTAATESDLVAISDWQNDILFQSYGIRAAHVVNNGINTAIFPEFNQGDRSVDLLAAGSFLHFKQYHLFIELVNYLRNQGYTDIKAILSGDGELQQQLAQLVNDYGLQNNITFTGRIPHKKLLELMNNTKLFVHPSTYEGHSTVVLEAMYSGCKVLGFIPAGSRPTQNFILCSDFDQMKQHALNILQSTDQYYRENYSDMEDSVKQLNAILINKTAAL